MDPRFFERYPELAHDIPMNKRKSGGTRVGFVDPGVEEETIIVDGGKELLFEEPGVFEILSPGQTQCWSPDV